MSSCNNPELSGPRGGPRTPEAPQKLQGSQLTHDTHPKNRGQDKSETGASVAVQNTLATGTPFSDLLII